MRKQININNWEEDFGSVINSLIFFVIEVDYGIDSALAGACVFLLRKKKGTKAIRPKQPALRETSATKVEY